MAEVYLARDERLGREVALKFVAQRNREDATAIARFVREARAASALNHPNIVTIYDIGESAEGRYIVMERVNGRVMRRIIGEPVPLESLIDWGRQMARALAQAHAAGIIHRDIKP